MRPRHHCIIFGETEEGCADWGYVLRTNFHLSTVYVCAILDLKKAMKRQWPDVILVLVNGQRLRPAVEVAELCHKLHCEKLVFAVTEPQNPPIWADPTRWIDAKYRTTVFETVELVSRRKKGPKPVPVVEDANDAPETICEPAQAIVVQQ